jgi:hypothetical protein
MKTLTIAAVLMVSFAAPTAVVEAQWPDHRDPRAPRNADGTVNLDGPAPRLPDGRPDFSGVWGFMGGTRTGALFGIPGFDLAPPRVQPQGPSTRPPSTSLDEKPAATLANIGGGFTGGLPLRPESAALVKQRMKNFSRDNPEVWCLPLGNQQFNAHWFPRKITQTPTLMLLLFETHMGVRQIFLDGRSLPTNDPQPWFFGYSVGRWEGDTLVVETIGFRKDGWLDVNGHPLGEKGRTIERFRRPNYGTIELEQTVDDPEHYTRPFTTTLTWRLMPDAELMEMVCTENNLSIQHLVPASTP